VQQLRDQNAALQAALVHHTSPAGPPPPAAAAFSPLPPCSAPGPTLVPRSPPTRSPTSSPSSVYPASEALFQNVIPRVPAVYAF
jgi:hypothetical protein